MAGVLCLIGDIVASRKIRDRQGFQRRLQMAIEEANRDAEGLVSPGTITLGDEFQAVYRRSGSLFRDAVHIQAQVHPQRVRFAIGVGSLSTAVNPARAIAMDGPAFHLARQGITRLRQEGGAFTVAGLGAEAGGWVLPVLDLISHTVSGWKRSRWEILDRRMRGEKVHGIVQAMRLTPAAVYKNLRAGALDTVSVLFRRVGRALDESLRR